MTSFRRDLEEVLPPFFKVGVLYHPCLPSSAYVYKSNKARNYYLNKFLLEYKKELKEGNLPQMPYPGSAPMY